MTKIAFALLSGLLFGGGLVISNMVNPGLVIGFLDVSGQWNPTLAFVMTGGLLVYLPLYVGLIKSRQKPLLNTHCELPSSTHIDIKLIAGAAIFGIGWGLSGICPGPAIVNLSGLQPATGIFVLTMLGGMIIGSKAETYL